jgi:hypothetical protein
LGGVFITALVAEEDLAPFTPAGFDASITG